MIHTENPLIGTFTTPFETAPFHLISEEDFLPALQISIENGRKEVEEIIQNPEAPTFENTIAALEFAGEEVGRTAEIFFNINSAETNDNIQRIARDFSPLITEYGSDIMLNEQLFARIEKVWINRDNEDLNPEQQRLLEKTYRAFVRNGALLGNDDKQKLRDINNRLATLSLSFGENVLAETHAFNLVVDTETDLAGLPDFVRESAAEQAQQKGMPGKWVFTLDAPSYMPFMTYASNRNLRKQMFAAFTSRAFQNNAHNNTANVLEIVQLRQTRAQILGYASHADFVLEERMAENPEKVHAFLKELLQKSKPAALRELDELKAYAAAKDGLNDLSQWDFTYYAEKLKKEKFDIDDELLKPYFSLENVIDGIFHVAYKLYGISFLQDVEIPVYHEDAKAYQVTDADGSHLAVLYTDFFPRPGKRNGAWMTSYRGQSIKNGENRRPHISIVCNFTKPTATKPSLLTFNEVTTLFHEFGHALHGILANTTYPSLSGTNVYWDFVELPSQFLDNCCFEKECLDLFARHYETAEPIPAQYIERLKSSATFHEGYGTMRQLGFGALDMAWHGQHQSLPADISAFELSALKETLLFQPLPSSNTSCAFSHIFQGGYSAGYYSYKWAEVLDADAFELFKEKGLFDAETALKFRQLLAAGGTAHPMELYKNFRGREPKVEALLERAGLV